MKHRGPDDQGVFIEDTIGFGFVRLSILDLSEAGHQPMISADGRYVIIFNGEVYNYLELRSELDSKYRFRSGTDTEVILTAYQEWGPECLSRFNGMFAMVILDRQEQKIFGARDRFGIKPLYYHLDDSRLIFASEIKSILTQLSKFEPNDRVINDYLLYNRTDHTEETFFKDIRKLNHGTYFTLKNGDVKFNKWYNLESHITDKLISPEEYRELLKESLKFRLRSDVPVGVCLSGGLDSSAIVASLTKDFQLDSLNTFSAVYDQSDASDESYYINKFRSEVRNMHFTQPSATSFFEDHIKFIEAHNEPVPDTGPYAQYKVMELATNHVTVTLDGQGADEQLGGYHYFFGSYYVELLRKLKLARLLVENYQYYRVHQSAAASKYFLYYLLPIWGQRMINKKLFPSVKLQTSMRGDDQNRINQMLYSPSSLRSSLIQHFEYKLEHLLRWEDLNSMSFSIESRVPFLDHRIVESTLSLPPEAIIKNGVSKYILRESTRDILPQEIYSRMDKKGFSNPREKWFRSVQFKSMIMDLLSSSKFRTRGYFDADIAKKRYQLHLSGKLDISKEIWKWINTEIWFNRFVDN